MQAGKHAEQRNKQAGWHASGNTAAVYTILRFVPQVQQATGGFDRLAPTVRAAPTGAGGVEKHRVLFEAYPSPGQSPRATSPQPSLPYPGLWGTWFGAHRPHIIISALCTAFRPAPFLQKGVGASWRPDVVSPVSRRALDPKRMVTP